jgi:hypothetical protein
VDWEPWIALEPDQPPEALQVVALVDDQVRVALPPLVMALGPTLKVTVGAGDLMVTVADCTALPPGPEQVSVYVAFADKTPVDCEPLAGLLPDQPPEAVHAVAFAAFQFSVALVPLEMVLGDTPMLTVGAACFTDTVADCVALPPGPLQVNV